MENKTKKMSNLQFLCSIDKMIEDIQNLSMYEERTFTNSGTHHEAKLFICINAIEAKNEIQELVFSKKNTPYKKNRIEDLLKRVVRNLNVAKAINIAYQQEECIKDNMQYLKNLK